jgi:hypothetical protein
MFLPTGAEVKLVSTVTMSEVYKQWDAKSVDALPEIITFIKSVLDTGVMPNEIQIVDLQWVEFSFLTTIAYLEFERAIRKVLDLLWLID